MWEHTVALHTTTDLVSVSPYAFKHNLFAFYRYARPIVTPCYELAILLLLPTRWNRYDTEQRYTGARGTSTTTSR